MLRQLKTACLMGLPLVFAFNFPAYGQAGQSAPTLLTQSINEAKMITLAGTTRPEAIAANDRGRVADGLAMEHLWLLLKRSPVQEQALNKYLAELQDPASPNFHHWISAAEFGTSFGLAQSDLATVTQWLESHGFVVNAVLPNRLVIDFSGTAGKIREVFRTEIHNLSVDGEPHMANMSDQQIPAALEPAVAGIVSLSNIHPHAMHPPPTRAEASFGSGRYMGAGDLATIYNLNPLFAAGISGKGQTIVVLEDSDVFDPSEWSQFRRLFGLTRPYINGTFTQIHPALVGSPCIDPGVSGDEDEATIDAQWASAAAPNANIVLAACDNTFNFGVFTALVNLLNAAGPPPAIMSISYGAAEAQQGSDGNAFINATYQQAVMEGVSVFVSSGDSGADNNTVDRSKDIAKTGISVNGVGSTPFNVAVGGTDFGDTFFGATNTYWNKTNSATFESALSYVPEIPWNNSCASQLIAIAYGFAKTYGPAGFCNSTAANNLGYLNVIAASGGPSSVYTKPVWQSVFGNPSDGVRDLPDVSLFAALSVSGAWNHAYIFCFSEPVGMPPDSFPCSQGFFFTAGGTSFSSPIMAAIQALVNQKTGERWGNPAPIYYSLANSEYGAGGNSACNSSLGKAVSPSCVFHDVTLGDMDILCKPGTPNCFSQPGDSFGVLSVSTSSYEPAYPAAAGWDFATGLGSVNAFKLVTNWPVSLPSSVNAQISPGTSGRSGAK